MQKLFTFVFALLLTLRLSAQHEPIQPFEQELGVKVKILTLSNGKYQETFANDTLLRIGSVMYNQFTGEVVSVIQDDTLYGEYNLRPEVVSRWLSPDPLAAQFPNWSPYNFVENNPIRMVDPTGMAPDDYVYLNTKGEEIGRVQSNTVKQVTIIADEHGAILELKNGVATVGEENTAKYPPTTSPNRNLNENEVAILHTHPNEDKGYTKFSNGTTAQFNDNGPSNYDKQHSPGTKGGFLNVVVDKNNIYFYNQGTTISISRSKL